MSRARGKSASLDHTLGLKQRIGSAEHSRLGWLNIPAWTKMGDRAVPPAGRDNQQVEMKGSFPHSRGSLIRTMSIVARSKGATIVVGNDCVMEELWVVSLPFPSRQSRRGAAEGCRGTRGTWAAPENYRRGCCCLPRQNRRCYRRPSNAWRERLHRKSLSTSSRSRKGSTVEDAAVSITIAYPPRIRVSPTPSIATHTSSQ